LVKSILPNGWLDGMVIWFGNIIRYYLSLSSIKMMDE